jgi:ferredoxin
MHGHGPDAGYGTAADDGTAAGYGYGNRLPALPSARSPYDPPPWGYTEPAAGPAFDQDGASGYERGYEPRYEAAYPAGMAYAPPYGGEEAPGYQTDPHLRPATGARPVVPLHDPPPPYEPARRQQVLPAQPYAGADRLGGGEVAGFDAGGVQGGSSDPSSPWFGSGPLPAYSPPPPPPYDVPLEARDARADYTGQHAYAAPAYPAGPAYQEASQETSQETQPYWATPPYQPPRPYTQAYTAAELAATSAVFPPPSNPLRSAGQPRDAVELSGTGQVYRALPPAPTTPPPPSSPPPDVTGPMARAGTQPRAAYPPGTSSVYMTGPLPEQPTGPQARVRARSASDTGPQTGPQTGPHTGAGAVVPYQPTGLTRYDDGASTGGAPVVPFRGKRGTRGRSGGGRRPTVSVDNNRCHLYAICQMEAPSTFDLGQDGRLRYDDSPPEHLRQQVEQAARLCPMQAIALREG